MALWTPADITTQLILDASDSGTITIATGVSQWNDKSGNAYHVAQSDTAKQPAVNTAAQNGLDTITFDGVDDVLFRSIDTSLTQNIGSVLLIAVRKAATAATQRFYLMIHDGTVDFARSALIVGRTANKAGTGGRRAHANTVNYIASAADVSTTTFEIHAGALDYTNSNADQYINGALDGATTSFHTDGNTENVASTYLSVGGTAASLFFQGDIAEIIVVHSDITTDTRQKLEGYLAHKWGIESGLPAEHPYKTAPPYNGFDGELTASYLPVAEISGAHGVAGGLDVGYAPIANVAGVHGVAGALDAGYAPAAEMLGLSGFNFNAILAASYAPVADIAGSHAIAAAIQAAYAPQAAMAGVRGVVSSLAVTYAPLADIAGTWSAEPTFSVELPLAITVEANTYTLSLPLAITVESLSYTLTLPLAITVEANTYTLSLPLEITIDAPAYTLTLPVVIDVFAPGNLDGDWLPELYIDGVEINYERLAGALNIVRGRSSSATAEFTYVLETAEAATFMLTFFRRKPVVIDAVAGSARVRVFSGKVQTATWDSAAGLVTLLCSDSLENHLLNMPVEDVAGFVSEANWSDAVFGEKPEKGREYLDQLLEIEAVTVQCDAYDLLEAKPLVATSTVATLTTDLIIDASQAISEVDEKQIVNRFEVELTSRAAACYGAMVWINYSLGESLTPVSGLPSWINALRQGGRLMDRGMIQQALESTGWRIEGDVNYTPPPAVFTYNIPGQASPLNYAGDVIFYLNPPELVDKFAIAFSANLRREWGQTVEAKDKLVVAWQASVNTYGELVEKEAYLDETDFDVQEWEASKDAQSPAVTEGASIGFGGQFVNGAAAAAGGVAITGTGHGLPPHMSQGITVKAGRDSLGWGSSEQTIKCVVRRCQNEIYKSQLGAYQVELMKIAPTLQLGDGIAIGAGLRIASAARMPLEQISHTWDFDGNQFFSTLTLGYLPVGTSASEASSTPQAFPVPVFGSDYLDTLGGFGASPVTYHGETEAGENRMEINLEAVADAYRETDTLDRTATPLTHGVWCAANNLTITAIERP